MDGRGMAHTHAVGTRSDDGWTDATRACKGDVRDQLPAAAGRSVGDDFPFVTFYPRKICCRRPRDKIKAESAREPQVDRQRRFWLNQLDPVQVQTAVKSTRNIGRANIDYVRVRIRILVVM